MFFYLSAGFMVIEPMNLYNKFERDVTKITPYVEEHEIQKIKSDWVCMRNKSDYEKIYAFITQIEDTYLLPK